MMSIRTDDRDEIAATLNTPGKIRDRAGIAELLGLTRYAVDEAIARGAPVLRQDRRQKDCQINSVEFLAWLVRDKIAPSPAEPRAPKFRTATPIRRAA